MKFTAKHFTTFLMALALTTLIGCKSTHTQESSGEYIDDTVITTRVKAAILKEPTLKSAEINVETFKGIVQLSGFVSSSTDQNKAAEIARSTPGVKSIRNDMRIK